MRSSLSKVSVDWTASSTPPPSMSSAIHDVPLRGTSAGLRAPPAGAAVWHAERATHSASAKNLTIGFTVHVLDTANGRAGKLDLGPEPLRAVVARRRALRRATSRDTIAADI